MLRRTIALFACTLALAGPARAVPILSDLWWNPDESGWGASITQQGNIVFVVIFAYAASGTPTWYVGPRLELALLPGNLDRLYSGPLYETRGPWFGGPFDVLEVSAREVGQVGVRYTGAEGARISYSVDGTSVSKEIRRQTWGQSNFSGEFLGASITTYRCPTNEPGPRKETGPVTITQADGQFSMRYAIAGRSCDYSGAYQQHGRFGRVLGGTATCADGSSHTFDAHHIEGTHDLFSRDFALEMSVGAAGSACLWFARVVGVR